MAQAAEADEACAAGRCEAVIDLLEREVRLRPTDIRAYYRLGLCYGGGCRRHSLIDPDMAVAYLRRAALLLPADRGQLRADILDALGTVLIRARHAAPVTALREAVRCHSEAAEVYESLGRPDDWARARFNLGNSWCELSEIAGEDHWSEAVSQYEASLRIRTRQHDPDRYATVLENLGCAYRHLPAGNAGGNVKKCLQCYQSALRVFSAAGYPEKHAGLHNNLGNAFLSLPETDSRTAARNARRALRHFDRALRVQSTNTRSRAYGITQYNRAQAFCRLAASSAAAHLERAVDCLKAAGQAFQTCGEDRYTQLVKAQLERILPSNR